MRKCKKRQIGIVWDAKQFEAKQSIDLGDLAKGK